MEVRIVSQTPRQPVGGLLEKRDVDNGLKAERSGVETVGTTNIGNATKEEIKPKGKKPAVSQGGRANHVQDYQLERKKEIVISTNADAKEIEDECGFNLYSRHAASQHDEAVEENGKSLSSGSIETTNNTELPVSAREHKPNSTAGISAKKDLVMASSKVILYSEKKMWQQINALQKIVGYKAVKHPTCLEELKALYLFTGVEPPASFKDPSDLQDTSYKLRYLMAVVGVK